MNADLRCGFLCMVGLPPRVFRNDESWQMTLPDDQRRCTSDAFFARKLSRNFDTPAETSGKCLSMASYSPLRLRRHVPPRTIIADVVVEDSVSQFFTTPIARGLGHGFPTGTYCLHLTLYFLPLQSRFSFCTQMHQFFRLFIGDSTFLPFP